MAKYNLRNCKNFISCQDCKHEDGCMTTCGCIGYCFNRITCITMAEESDYCHGCDKFVNKNPSTFLYNNYDEKKLTPDEKEKKKMIEFFFPKQKKPNNPDYPWEFL